MTLRVTIRPIPAVLVALVALAVALPRGAVRAQSHARATGCAPRHVQITGGSARSCCPDARAYWDGRACVAIGGCTCGGDCTGPDCAELYPNVAACDRAFARCRAVDASVPADAATERRLAPPPAGLGADPRVVAWPSRVCAVAPRPGAAALRVENDCGCGDALVCAVTSVRRGVVSLQVHTDPSRHGACDDCYAMVPATCALPALAAGHYRVQIHGAPALEFDADASGQLAAGACWPSPAAR